MDAPKPICDLPRSKLVDACAWSDGAESTRGCHHPGGMNSPRFENVPASFAQAEPRAEQVREELLGPLPGETDEPPTADRVDRW